MDICEKIAYIKGLAEGLDLKKDDKETKIFEALPSSPAPAFVIAILAILVIVAMPNVLEACEEQNPYSELL